MGGHYATVFDATTAGWRTWPGILFGAVFICVGLAILLRPQWFRRDRAPPRAMGFFFTGFATLWTSFVAYGTWHEYARVMDAAAAGTLKAVEGKVEKFVPMPYTGHATEHFCVRDACFAYSDYLVTTGFNNTSSHGGPIHAGLPVRVTYLDGGGRGNIIVKLEVEQ